VSAFHDHDGAELYHHNSQTRRVLDARVAFLMTDMLQEVMRSGTAAGVRARGFTPRQPARPARRTMAGSLDDTSRLLCVVWFGFDDYLNSAWRARVRRCRSGPIHDEGAVQAIW